MLRKFRETLKNKQRGAIMVFFAILVPLFLGAIGLAVDAGFLYMQKAKLQDVADATALAGAGHLNDENRKEQVKNAIVAFARANGYGKDKDEAVSSKFSELGDGVSDSSVTLEENASWKIAHAIDTGVKDKDGKQRDHVRVVILKRVPTFFIRMLFPEQQEVVVKAVAAAEYVEGEEPEPVISGDTPVIFVEGTSAETFQCYESANNIVLGKNFNFPIYIKDGNIDTTKLPGTGNLYVSNNVLGTTAKYDESKNNIAWDPPINNRNVFYKKGNYPARPTSGVYWNDDKKKQEWEDFKKKYDETRAKADAKYEEVKNKLISEANTKAQDIEAYKKGEGIKRYIGLDASGKPYSNIKEEDKTIELYMSGTYFETVAEPSKFFAKDRSVITNRQLKNVNTITTLVSDKPCMIGTTGIIYGNIYLLEKDGIGLDIAGSGNNFNGTLYSPGNLYVGGENNHFLGDTSSSAEVSIFGKNVYLGKWIKVSESIVTEYSFNFVTNVWKTDKCIKIEYNGDTLVDAKNDSNWCIQFGDTSASSSGSSSGSSGSGAAKAHVRLVI